MAYKELKGQRSQQCPQDFVPGRLGGGGVRGRDNKFIIVIC